MKRYLVIGGTVISKKDGQEHYVNARKLCELYMVNPRECVLMEENDNIMRARRAGWGSMLILRPRHDSNYNLEEIEAAAERLKQLQKKK